MTMPNRQGGTVEPQTSQVENEASEGAQDPRTDPEVLEYLGTFRGGFREDNAIFCHGAAAVALNPNAPTAGPGGARRER